ncbi:MAG: rhodanese family protein [Methyloceanibacter sp.]
MSLPTIAPKDARRLIDQGATLVDIRSAEEHGRLYIPGSLLGPVEAMPSLDEVSKPIIFHCRTGQRTKASAAQLKEAAAGEAYILSGGLDAWRLEGLPCHLNTGLPLEIHRQVMIVAGSLVLLCVLLGIFVSPIFYLFAAVPGAGLLFGGAFGICGMAKLLGVMPWNRPAAGT